MLSTPTKPARRDAFTLIEVILSLAILAGAVAVLGEVMSIAGRSAADAQALAEAQLLASSIMDEILAGSLEMTQQTQQPLESDAAIPWIYSVTITDTTLTGLLSLEVLVEQDVEEPFRPVKYRLVRWVASEDDSSETDDSTEGSDDA